MAAELSWEAKKAQPHRPCQQTLFKQQQYASYTKTWGKAWNEWKLRCTSWMAKEKRIDSVTCAAWTAKNTRAMTQRASKNKSGLKTNRGCWTCVLQLVVNCRHCTKVKQWVWCSLADVVAVSPKNNAALTGQIGGGLIGWLVGCVAERW